MHPNAVPLSLNLEPGPPVALGLLAVAILWTACSGESVDRAPGTSAAMESVGDGDGNGDGPGGDGSGGTTSSTSVAACDPPCAAGEYCSASSQCIRDNTCIDTRDCDGDLLCDQATNLCLDASCGSEEFEIAFIEPNMFVSLDRSCSMNQSMWESAIDAVVQLTTEYDGKMRFGLALFPDTEGDNCTQGAPAVSIGVNQELMIQNILQGARVKNDAVFPEYDELHPGAPCVTNIDTAILQASVEPAFAVGDRPNYILLITDGKQFGCPALGGDDYTLQLIKDLAAAGTHTFIVGFGGGVDPDQLNEFAVAGREPRNDPDVWYYQADDAIQLSEALSELAATVVGCDFALDTRPPMPEQLFVFFDDNAVARDDPNGWSYDEANNSVSFAGTACETIKRIKELDIDIVFGCPVPSPD